jgi:hypothetical protein
MGEAYGGHEILNPDGLRIRVTRYTLRRLDMQGFLFRDRESRLLAFKPQYAGLYREMIVDRELGPDFSGPSVCVCRCPECHEVEADLEHKRVSSEYAAYVVHEVRRGRRTR